MGKRLWWREDSLFLKDRFDICSDARHACLCTILYSHKKAQNAQILDYDLVRRNKRLQLQGMEGKFLSRNDRAERHALVLRFASARGRVEQHFLSDAAAQHDRNLEGAGAGELSFLSESPAVYYSLQTPE